MGAAPSAKPVSLKTQEQEDSDHLQGPKIVTHYGEIVRLMMPVYYTTEVITFTELETAQESWRLIVNC
jgi:hypothetical protein